MGRGFHTFVAAQFFSSLADNALLIAAIALLNDMNAPEWMTPALKLFFNASYVLLAAFAGTFADAFPKNRVMFFTNLIKTGGCIMILFGLHPLVACGVAGFGAAIYSPAKYGILPEIFPEKDLVAANGWVEGSTVFSIVFGAVLGSALVGPHLSQALASLRVPEIAPRIHSAGAAAIVAISAIYAFASFLNFSIPATGAACHRKMEAPGKLLRAFTARYVLLWRDSLARVSLTVTTLLWGASATLQFIVLKWAAKILHFSLSKAALLQAVVAVGVAFGAFVASRYVPLNRALKVLPVGLAIGLLVISLTLVKNGWGACVVLISIGVLAGYFVVPMNALLQHRGHILMSAGQSVAVQNLSENLSIVAMLALYAAMVSLDIPITRIMIFFGLLFFVVIMLVLFGWRRKRCDVSPI
jgi:MFS family permease